MHTLHIVISVVCGLAGYVGLILLVARCMAFGMGTLPAKQQVVLDVFDGQRIVENRAAKLAALRDAQARKDTRAMNVAAARARLATIAELQATVRGGR